MLSGCAATGYNSSFTTTSVVFSYPVTAPAISIARPVNGASYAQGQAVSSSFTCDDGAGGNWLASCVDQSGRPSGSSLDTSTLGSHTFTVTGTTRDGMTSTASVTYKVVPSGGGAGGGVFPGAKLLGGTFTVQNGAVKLKVTCPPGQFAECVGTDTLSTIKGFAVAVKHRHKVSLGSARFSIPAGQTKILTIKLTRKARILLARLHKLKVLETVVAHDPAGQAKATQTTITIKLAAKHRA
jgi:hypothetical protein